MENTTSTTSEIDFVEQISTDQRKYSRYVCDSRAIPNAIDGLKPVQRRILWTMWNSSARDNYTKTVKVAGMVMAYHPHGNASIEDAIALMTQQFSFANNYSLIAGEGTFGDVLDPKAIASPRYTEVKLSDFVKDLGLFESLPDLDYIQNYDETDQEPIFFVPKIPTVILNPVLGIATGFRCNIPGHKLSDVVNATVTHLRRKKTPEIYPWYRDYQGKAVYQLSETGVATLSTGFHFHYDSKNKSTFLTHAPQGWNREKTIQYLETIIKDQDNIKDYLDHSKTTFLIELIFKKGSRLSIEKLENIFNKVNVETIDQNVITHEGELKNQDNTRIIKQFCEYRKKHLILRFQRLAGIEQEKMNKLNELIRFIKEKWHERTLKLKNRKHLIDELGKNKFVFTEWLAEIPIYRLTTEEVAKCQKAVNEAKKKLEEFQNLAGKENLLVRFMIKEMEALKKWDA